MGENAVSVAIPALNEEHYLPVLLRSLCAQRGVRLDVVVVEGNSDDKTVMAAREVIAGLVGRALPDAVALTPMCEAGSARPTELEAEHGGHAAGAVSD